MKSTTPWSPNLQLLEWFFERQSTTPSFDNKSICCPDGTEKGGNGRSMREVIEEMREGTEFGKMMYQMIETQALSPTGVYAKEFRTYREQHKQS